MRFRKKHAILTLALLAAAAVGLAAGRHALAQTAGQVIQDTPIYQEVVLPGSKVELTVDGFLRGRVYDLAAYLGTIYNFLLSIVGALAAVFMMIGGFQYLTAGGDKSKVDAGKKRITNAVMGMILALTSYVILNAVNPDLVNLKVPKIEKVQTELSIIPYCEDLEKSGYKVEILSGKAGNTNTDCGVLGAATKKGPSTPATDTSSATSVTEIGCIYRGSDCGMEHHKSDDGDLSFDDLSICVPVNWVLKGGAQGMKDLIANSRGRQNRGDYGFASLGQCYSCGDWDASNQLSSEKGGHISDLSQLCGLWQQYAILAGTDYTVKTQAGQARNSMVTYCAPDPLSKHCASLSFQCGDSPASSSCSDYKGKKFLYYFDVAKQGYGYYGKGYITGGNYGELGSHPKVLNDICLANPCGYNSGKGCKDSDGLIDGTRQAAIAVRYETSGSWECYNK